MPKGRPGVGAARKGKKKQVIQEVQSDGTSSEGDDMNMEDQNNMGPEILHLSPEELDKNVTKTLTFDNPNAPTNIAQFSYKDRQFKIDEMVDQLMIHFKFEGDILKKDSEDANDQETFWDDKRQANQAILNQMNQSILDDIGDPCKFLPPNPFCRRGQRTNPEEVAP
jgi:dynein intermediate chain 1